MCESHKVCLECKDVFVSFIQNKKFCCGACKTRHNVRAWKKLNRDKVNKWNKDYRKRNGEARRVSKRRYYQRNREALNYQSKCIGAGVKITIAQARQALRNSV